MNYFEEMLNEKSKTITITSFVSGISVKVYLKLFDGSNID